MERERELRKTGERPAVPGNSVARASAGGPYLCGAGNPIADDLIIIIIIVIGPTSATAKIRYTHNGIWLEKTI